MLEYNEITEKKYIIYENEPYEVISSHVFRKQQRKPVNATKLKNLITGRVAEISFHQSEKVEEAEIEKKEVKYLYKNKGEYWFCEISDPAKRFTLKEDTVGSGGKFIKQNSTITLLMFGEKVLGVKLPIKVELKVTEAYEVVKGNTAQGASKQVVLETGTTVSVPMFIKEGEMIRVNTETGEYAERASGNSF